MEKPNSKGRILALLRYLQDETVLGPLNLR